MIVDAKLHRGGAQAAPVGPENRPRTIGPFAMIAHILPKEMPAMSLPPDMDVRAHPHIGLGALSYLLEGYVTHRDNLGTCCELCPGGVGFMIAGRGAVHSERFERMRVLGGRFQMFQILLALPDGSEDMEPGFAYVEVPEVAGRRSLHAAIQFPAPILLEDVGLETGARYEVPDHRERALYVMSGEIEVGGERARAQQTALLEPGAVTVTAVSAARILAFGGEPVGPRYSWWNYIHSSLDTLEAAKAAWRSERIPRPPGDTESFTPAPPDDGRPLVLLNRVD